MILLAIIVFLGLLTHLLPESSGDSSLVLATLSDILMAPILGFESSIPISLFIIILGGFISIINNTSTIDVIKELGNKFKGKETNLIISLMFIFSLLGLIGIGFEQVLIFFLILTLFMYFLDLDKIISTSIIVLGLGSGMVGGTITKLLYGNLPSLFESNINNVVIIVLSIIIYSITLFVSIWGVLTYSVNSKKNTILCEEEKEIFLLADKNRNNLGYKKVNLILLGVTLLFLLLSFIPWNNYHISLFDNWTSLLTGESFGNWGMYDASLWLVIMSIVFSVVNKLDVKEFLDKFIKGSSKMMKVIFIVSSAYGIFILVRKTNLDNYLLTNFHKVVENCSLFTFTPINYIYNCLYSFFNSDINSISNIAFNNKISQEVLILTSISSSSIVKIISPTSVAMLAGITMNGIEFSTWFKWIMKIFGIIVFCIVIILSLATIILSI